jgi:hypothetical protein
MPAQQRRGGGAESGGTTRMMDVGEVFRHGSGAGPRSTSSRTLCSLSSRTILGRAFQAVNRTSAVDGDHRACKTLQIVLDRVEPGAPMLIVTGDFRAGATSVETASKSDPISTTTADRPRAMPLILELETGGRMMQVCSSGSIKNDSSLDDAGQASASVTDISDLDRSPVSGDRQKRASGDRAPRSGTRSPDAQITAARQASDRLAGRAATVRSS